MKELIFKLSKSEFLKIVPDYNLDFNEIDYCCDTVNVYFFNEIKLRIGQQSAIGILEPFITCLKKAVHVQLQLHESLVNDIGFMQNEYYENDSGFFEVSRLDSSSSYWIGFDYRICSAYDDANPYTTAWLYNDKDNIIFEVTSDYKWHLVLEGESEDHDFITYEEFMKDYKPLIHRIIPREIAVEWLDLAMKTYRKFYTSEELFQRAINRVN